VVETDTGCRAGGWTPVRRPLNARKGQRYSERYSGARLLVADRVAARCLCLCSECVPGARQCKLRAGDTVRRSGGPVRWSFTAFQYLYGSVVSM
jgi:hypothetical protein